MSNKEENVHRVLLHRLATLHLRLSGFYPLSQRSINQLYTEIVVAIACEISRTVSLSRFSLHYSDFFDIVRVIVDCYSDCEDTIIGLVSNFVILTLL